MARQTPRMQPAGRLLSSSQLVERTMSFLDNSPDPFHATEQAVQALLAAGFTRLSEREPWGVASGGVALEKGGRYFYTRNRSAVVAFVVGGDYKPGHGVKVIAAHIDSPNLKVKPRSARIGAGAIQLAVECYGGGLWHTWFDRDLSVSGKVLVRGEDGKIEQRLVKIDRPLLRVPTLCIHLQTAEERAAFKVNKEEHLRPVLALQVEKALTGEAAAALKALTGDGAASGGKGDGKGGGRGKVDAWMASQEPLLVLTIAEELGVKPSQIADFELNLYDTQRAAITGARAEFLASARLDNLVSSHLALEAITAPDVLESIKTDRGVSMMVLFDHEEVGSSSTTGAGSPIMGEALRRISRALSPYMVDSFLVDDELYAAATSRSFVLSADMAHAVHPNYACKHEAGHMPKMNGGLVIKNNGNQRYASNGITSFLVREIARKADLPAPQEFVVRNDCGCGSTIGPIISSDTGIRAVDVGLPQLSMHSVREMMGAADLQTGLDFFRAFYKHFDEVDAQLQS